MYRNCDRYILLSERFIPVLKRVSLLHDTSKVKCIPNPLTITPVAGVGFKKKEKLCLFVARLVQDKGVKRVMEIWHKVSKQHPDWRLEIVGDGEMRDWMKEYTAQNGLENSVSFEGFQSQMEPYYQRASILLLASDFEGWWLTLVEAMSEGCVPIAFSSYRSIFDIIDDGVNGLLVNPFDIDCYASELHRLMSDTAFFTALQQNAVTKSNCFKIDKIGQQWQSLIESDSTKRKEEQT